MMNENTAFKSTCEDSTFAHMEPQAQCYTITIKLKPYLQEFLKCKLRDAQITASKKNLVGVILRPFLEIRAKEMMPVFHRNDPDYITFQLPKYHDLNTHNGGAYISEENQKHFQDILETYFKDFFFSYMDDKVRYGKEANMKRGIIKKIIIQFCADLCLPYNQINYEMLKKSYYRHKLEITKKNPFIWRNLSLTCPLFFLL